ncbi:tetratricopeptide repeat-containing diguanylate cyclase [Bowmanella denitrificans]
MNHSLHLLTLLLCLLLCLSYTTHAKSSHTRELIEQAKQQREMGEFGQAVKTGQLALSLAKDSGNQADIGRAMVELGEIAREQGRLDDSMEQLEAAQAILQHTNDIQAQARAIGAKADNLRILGQHPNALILSQKSLELYKSIDDELGMADEYSAIGVSLEWQGAWQESLLAYNNALDIAKKYNDTVRLATAFYNIGEIHRDMGDQNTALTYFQDALRLDMDSGQPRNIAYSHTKVATVLKDLGNIDEARQHIKQAQALFEQLEAKRDALWAKLVLARIEFTAHNIALAEQLLLDGLQGLKEKSVLDLKVDAKLQLAELYLSQNNLELAKQHIEQGHELAVTQQSKDKQARFEEFRVALLARQEDYKQAFLSLQKVQKLKGELLDQTRAESLARMQSQAEFTRRAQEILLLKKDQELQRAAAERERILWSLWIVALVSAFLVLFLAYGKYSQRRQTRQLSEQVAQRTAQLNAKHQELQEAYSQVEQASTTDPLTGLRNRRFLEQNLQPDLQRSLRIHRDRPHDSGDNDLLFFLVDLDDFKRVNDVHGHSAGDLLLQQFAQLLQQVFRSSDYLVRWGGEEFLVISRFTSRQQAAELAQRLLTTVLEHPFTLSDGTLLPKSCSIGYSCYPLAPEFAVEIGWQQVLEAADACLYAAKLSGKHCWIGIEGPRQTDLPTLPFSWSALAAAGQLRVRASINKINWPPQPD